MKKFFSILMVLSILFSLCACGSNGGDANIDDFKDAITSTPSESTPETTESLSECDVNGHVWVDANYQTPKTCSVCNITEGDVVTASFVEHDLSINITELNKEYDYVTVCNGDKSKETIGKLSISNYHVFDGDESHPALDGYEWHAVTVTIRFDDENAWNYGCNVKTCNENYYDVVGWDKSAVELEGNMYQHTVNYNGIDYAECLYDDGTEYVWSEWVDKACTCTFERYVRVPVGYDGIVLGFRNAGVEWGEGKYIFDIADENTLFFRLDGTNAK